MRRFELVDDKSAKFWEISVDATEVSVRYGRIGANGQTRTKSLASAAVARDHAERQVAAKLGEGYTEIAADATSVSTAAIAPGPEGGTIGPNAPDTPVAGSDAGPVATAGIGPSATPSLADDDAEDAEADAAESVWTVPAAWWRGVEPVRGFGPTPAFALDTAARQRVAELVSGCRARLDTVLDNPLSESALVDATRQELGRADGASRLAGRDGDPLGAACLAVTVVTSIDRTRQEKCAVFVDHWISEHGLAFAVEAAARSATVTIDSPPFAPGARRRRLDDVFLATRAPGRLDTHASRSLWRRLRALLAAVDDDATRAAALARLDAIADEQLALRVAAWYLAPERDGHGDACLEALRAHRPSASPGSTGLDGRAPETLLSAVTTAAQAEAVLDLADTPWWLLREPALLRGASARVGPGLLPVLEKLLGVDYAASTRRVLALIERFPTDAAFEALLARVDERYVEPTLLAMTRRFPRRAARLLARAASGPARRSDAARELLRGHLVAHPDLAPLAAAAAPAAAVLVARLVETSRRVEPAAPETLPAVLVAPPWTSTGRARAPTPTRRLDPIAETPTALCWRPGEREAWAGEDEAGTRSPARDWTARLAGALRDGWGVIEALAGAPVELARPALAKKIRLGHVYGDSRPALERLLAVHGEDALELVLDAVAERPAALASVLLPVEGGAIARRMLEWYTRTKKTRPTALAWFERHPRSAAEALVPTALGRAGARRAMAEELLRRLGARGRRDAIEARARDFGAPAAAAVAALLDADPLEILPARMPKPPAWLDPVHLPEVLLADRRRALPAAAVGHLVTMLAIGTPEAPYAGLAAVREVSDAGSLAATGRALLERWRGAGYPARDGWVLAAQGLVGDDESARQLAEMIRRWPGESAHARAVAGLDALAAIGSDVALMQLHGIAEKAKFRGLRTKAREKLEEVAAGLGLDAERLADRLVPEFGLDADGTMLLDYGPRRFRVGFDEQLKPFVADEDGSPRRSLPRPNARDDPDRAPSAAAAFKALKKDVRAVAAERIRRFERAMVEGRRWPAEEFRELFVAHPLVWHLARRLVWAVYDDADGAIAFRVAEDRSFADADDATFSLDAAARVGIAHPLQLGDAVASWAELFADYEILQPFAQLGREVHALDDAERGVTRLDRLAGVTVATGRVLGLMHRGWERGTPQDAGVVNVMYRRVAPDRFAVIDLDPGIYAGEAMAMPEQSIPGAWLATREPSFGNPRGERPLGELDAVAASELLRDLETLRP